MSVEPWMLAWPRRARIPPPGRPMLPSRSWMIDAVLRPADGVDECRGPVAPGAGAQLLGNPEEERSGHPARLLDDLGRVAGVVALQDLVDAVRVLQGRIPVGRPARDDAPMAAELVPYPLARPAPLAR